jgi:spore maturation protein CgeB
LKILIITPPWIGGLFNSLSDAFINLGNEVIQTTFKQNPSLLRKLKLQNIIQIRNHLEKQNIYDFNISVRKQFKEFKPDIFLSMNEAYLLPDTVKMIQKENCHTINFVADNPFDPLRFSFFPITLKYYNLIFVHDRIWIPSIRNVAPKSKIMKLISGGAFNPEIFYPVGDDDLSEEDNLQFSCDLSFTGESYGMRGEAGYRSDILDQLGKYIVKIWGDSDWGKRFSYYSNLKRFYQGERLHYDQLRKLYKICTINLNMPSPQIFTGFQPRTFEIAACKGFQIADWREELDDWFSEDELVTFKNIPDLLEKADYFLKNPDKRIPYIDRMYAKVVKDHTWDQRIKEILGVINLES